MSRELRKIFLYSCMFAVLAFHPAGASGADPGTGIASHVMVPIPAGTFRMGSSVTEANRGNSETQHFVTITKGFLMGKYAVTQELYEEVMGHNPSFFTIENGQPPAPGEAQAKRPVERVSWYAALVFCNKLSMREGLTPVYSISGSTDPARWGNVPTHGNNATWDAVSANWNANGYRLPTEAEWEYACRAGTTTKYNLGNTLNGAWGWYDDNSGNMTHEVGKKAPNAWGLHDMHGNVWEWVWDWYGKYASGSASNPTGPAAGASRVVRGGAWFFTSEFLSSAYRIYLIPVSGYIGIGFRLARNSN